MPNSGRSRFPFTILAAAAIALAAYQSLAATPPPGVPARMHAPAAANAAASGSLAPSASRWPASEPAILAVFGAGLIGAAGRLRRRKVENR
jgi:hypothetical protein